MLAVKKENYIHCNFYPQFSQGPLRVECPKIIPLSPDLEDSPWYGDSLAFDKLPFRPLLSLGVLLTGSFSMAASSLLPTTGYLYRLVKSPLRFLVSRLISHSPQPPISDAPVP